MDNGANIYAHLVDTAQHTLYLRNHLKHSSVFPLDFMPNITELIWCPYSNSLGEFKLVRVLDKPFMFGDVEVNQVPIQLHRQSGVVVDSSQGASTQPLR